MPKLSKAASKSGTDLTTLRSEITELVARNAVTMVQHAIDAVNEEGQFQAIKYLFEMIGLYPGTEDTSSPVEDSLAARLLQQLGLECKNKNSPALDSSHDSSQR
jgi:hypothetical protein